MMIDLSDTQSILQLSAALNIAYFTIRDAARPHYRSHEFLMVELKKLHSELHNDSESARRNVEEALFELERFFHDDIHMRDGRDSLWFYSGMFMFLLSLMLLFASSSEVSIQMSQTQFFLVTVVLFFPIILSVIREIRLRVLFLRQINAAYEARSDALRAMLD